MKIAITSTGRDLEAPVDARFGRAARFILYDTENETFEVVDNQQNLNIPQGAGIQSAQKVSELGAEVVITGHCGPKAFSTLQAAGIQVVVGASGTVSQALERWRKGELKPASGADVQGHW